VIGAGNVGAKAVYLHRGKNIADIVMVDVATAGALEGAGLPSRGAAARYEVDPGGPRTSPMIEGSDVVVITGGNRPKPGMERMDLLEDQRWDRPAAAREIARSRPQRRRDRGDKSPDVIQWSFGGRRVLRCGKSWAWRAFWIPPFPIFHCGEARRLPGDVQAMVLGSRGRTWVPVTSIPPGGDPHRPASRPADIEALVEADANNGGAEIVASSQLAAHLCPGRVGGKW